MDETIAWLRDCPYYEGQIRDERVVPTRAATHADCEVADRLASALADRGIERPYAHQSEAVDAVRDGENVVLATETASGKSLAYTIPAVERALDRRATTLYVAPQVALINDQTETLEALAGDLGFASGVRVAQYTGRQSRSEKEAIRDSQPTVLLTTPDMLHYGILPHARRLWDWFFERLETVVIDEVHEYRGVFGSHVSLVARRLARMVERFADEGPERADGDPNWICCSATIGNPVEHAAAVTGRSADSFPSPSSTRTPARAGRDTGCCGTPPSTTAVGGARADAAGPATSRPESCSSISSSAASRPSRSRGPGRPPSATPASPPGNCATAVHTTSRTPWAPTRPR